MGGSGRLARAATWLEHQVDRLRPAPRGEPMIAPYWGLQTPDGILLRGRVLMARPVTRSMPDASRLTNLRHMLSLFVTRELPGVAVEALGYRARTDEEGYFALRLPVADGEAQTEITICIAETGVTAQVPIFAVRPGAQFGVISDIDDTIMQTGAYSLARNLWTTLTGNSATRHVFDDAVQLLKLLSQDGRNPVFYVSSSPWNLHGFLTDVFRRVGLPAGPMFLRDLGIDEDRFITGSHGAHKSNSIDRILAARPSLGFTLIGDTGQHDAAIYLDVVRRHEGRVRRVILRKAGSSVAASVSSAVDEIARSGVPVTLAADYRDVIAALASTDQWPETQPRDLP